MRSARLATGVTTAEDALAYGQIDHVYASAAQIPATQAEAPNQ